ncbi:hypothetical protein M409DRAFT_52513 [Zasmidium cellare ATCC 36951]|uniref:F-box domain-containing protein n=1 Tax=Zasmidium cellare ATCC 36951 TaxID=1080233 RepID=A0A6A6CPN5_ZASCE|nr:uncharacterized protein M409DRAFT_52513 [Zasmidium cellare ATCC 36951]KAF2169247.1 hypothetical protein M409DRAFT_52513 [Zasmidium cellare ATCC 36951]
MPRRSARLNTSQSNPSNLGSTYVAPAPISTNNTSSIDDPNQSATPFPFLDLPPEVRNRVYSFAFSNIATRDLSQTRIPPVALVSHQLRDKALLVLFASPHFRLTAGNNFTAKFDERWHFQMGRTYYRDHSRSGSGTIGMKRIIGRFLKDAGEAALFRNITFEVFDSSDIRDAREWERQGRPRRFRDYEIFEDQVAVRLHLGVVEGSLQVSFVDGRHHPAFGQRPYSGRVGEAQIVRDVDGSVDKAISVAQDIAGHDEFKGFKITDLRKIATAFRLE